MSSFSVSMLSPSVVTGYAGQAASTRIFNESSKLCFPGRNTTDTGIIGVPHDSVVGETAGCDDPSNRIDVYNDVVVPTCVLGGRLCFNDGGNDMPTRLSSGRYDTMVGIVGNRSGGPLSRPTDMDFPQREAQQKMQMSQFRASPAGRANQKSSEIMAMGRNY